VGEEGRGGGGEERMGRGEEGALDLSVSSF